MYIVHRSYQNGDVQIWSTKMLQKSSLIWLQMSSLSDASIRSYTKRAEVLFTQFCQTYVR